MRNCFLSVCVCGSFGAKEKFLFFIPLGRVLENDFELQIFTP
jgi:hypothetical protein